MTEYFFDNLWPSLIYISITDLKIINISKVRHNLFLIRFQYFYIPIFENAIRLIFHIIFKETNFQVLFNLDYNCYDPRFKYVPKKFYEYMYYEILKNFT